MKKTNIFSHSKLHFMAIFMVSVLGLVSGCGDGPSQPLTSTTASDTTSGLKDAVSHNSDGSYVDHLLLKDLPTPYYVEVTDPIPLGTPGNYSISNGVRSRVYLFQEGVQVTNENWNPRKLICQVKYRITDPRVTARPRHIPLRTIGVITRTECNDVVNFGAHCLLKSPARAALAFDCGFKGTTTSEKSLTVADLREAFGPQRILVMPCPPPSADEQDVCSL